jgi:septum formation protein
MTPPPLILGSASPRRRQLFSQFLPSHEAVSSRFDEDSVPFRGSPPEYVEEIALGKAEWLSQHHDADAMYLTADTTVWANGRVYAKPLDYTEAEQMLSELQGKWHEVWTALCLYHKGQVHIDCSRTRVKFRPVDARFLQAYVREVGALDKAAAYAIQGIGGLIVEEIEGCYYNVMGLPLQGLNRLL